MKLYLQDLIGRLAKFSKKLDNTSLFIDKPWVLIDENSDYHKYIFKRNGELIMSLNGQVQIGKWEYLSSAKSILIDRVADKILLNHSFFDPAVMILKIDGSINNLFVLANETIIPDLDVRKYLQAIIYQKHNISTGKLENGKTLEIYRKNSSEVLPGMAATIDSQIPEDGIYRSIGTGLHYEIRNGALFKIMSLYDYQTPNGQTITILQEKDSPISIGDLVYIDEEPAQSGKYKLKFLNTITVVDGKISKKSFF